MVYKILRGILLLLRNREIRKIYSIEDRHTYICWLLIDGTNKKETNPIKPLQESEKINLRNDSILELDHYCRQLELFILNESDFVSQVNLGPN